MNPNIPTNVFTDRTGRIIMKTVRIGDVQNALVRLILWQIDREPITDVHLRASKDYFDNQCTYCGEEKNLVFDHAVPINRTALGQHRIGNLVPSCSDCNQKKDKKISGII
jgi:5-methylcytosine-specific restriction endonuclease McrA